MNKPLKKMRRENWCREQLVLRVDFELFEQFGEHKRKASEGHFDLQSV